MENLPLPEEASLRVSTQERERITTLLQAAFAEGMLDEEELDSRVHAALAAKTRGELYPLVSDLAGVTEEGIGAQRAPAPTSATSRPAGRFMTTYGSTVERIGHWIVPSRLRPIIFKGKAVIDLTAAELTSTETRLRVTAYKSTVEIIVPRDLAVDARGFAYKGDWVEANAESEPSPARGALRIRGIAYKSRVIIRRA